MTSPIFAILSVMLLEASGYRAKAYESAVAFLASDAPQSIGCLIVDVRMPDMDGLQLQQELLARHSLLPVIIMTGHGDIPIAVQAMKAGAVDFLEKPFDDDVLLDSVRRALDRATSVIDHANAAKEASTRLTQLTDRERQVLDLIVAGKANKVIAYELSISPANRGNSPFTRDGKDGRGQFGRPCAHSSLHSRPRG